jgi:hypothetical protein
MEAGHLPHGAGDNSGAHFHELHDRGGADQHEYRHRQHLQRSAD